MPSVSVLMSIYRPDLDLLAEQLETIGAQDYEDFEVVVYNDCPEDVSHEDFCRQHIGGRRLRYLHGKANLGYSKAFETLVEEAEGDYIAFADQDDRWLPGRLAQGARALDEGYLLVSCDRQIIDAQGQVVEESWKASHPKDDTSHWKSGDDITAKAAFACYSIGMATMMRRDIAQQLLPFPSCTGHDKWLALGASALGPCANLDETLVQYRRHGINQTGTLYGVETKEDWYRTRTENSHRLVAEFAKRFPEHPDVGVMTAFAEARLNRDVSAILKYRRLSPEVAFFEAGMALLPEGAFKMVLRLLKREG